MYRIDLFWRRGQVGKAEVCKTLTSGSNPLGASIINFAIASYSTYNSKMGKIGQTNKLTFSRDQELI